MKICSRCKKEKSLDNFSRRKASKDGINACCKDCELVYRRSKEGLLVNIFKHHRYRVKQRNIPLNYTKDELKSWLFNNPSFDLIYNNWKNSGYNKRLYPSIDRIDDYKGYSLDNIQLITWEENFKKSIKDKLDNKTTKDSTSVIQYNIITGEKIQEFASLRHAQETTEICSENIRKVCKNERNHAGGFYWKYKNKNMGYKDKTWCTFKLCKHFNNCTKALTDKHIKNGEKWWGNKDFPYMKYLDKPNCYENKRNTS